MATPGGGRMTSLSGVMRDAILQLCRANVAYRGHVEVDGIICISGQDEGQQIVVKVHEQLFSENELHKRFGSEEREHSPEDGINHQMKRPRLEQDFSPSRPTVVEKHDEEEDEDEEIDVTEVTEITRRHKEPPVPYIKQERVEGGSPHPLVPLPDSSRGAIDLSTHPALVSHIPEAEHRGYGVGFAESRLRSLLTKSAASMHRPHNMVPFLPRRPMFPNPMMLSQPSPECKTCGLVIAEPELLREHNETHHGVFTCRICYRTFTSRSNLERHSRLHTGHKPYICSKCGKAFSRKDHLTNHSAKHAFKCGKCLKRFVEKDALATHYLKDHNVELTNICAHCNKGFTDPRVYSEHVKTHPENFSGHRPQKGGLNMPTAFRPRRYNFKCQECGMMYADALDLARHMHSEHMLYSCLGCYECFADPLLYSQHFLTHQGEMNIFECYACRQICVTYEELREHEQGHHQTHHPGSLVAKATIMPEELAGETDTYLCPYCAKVFPNESLLMEHVSIHEGLQRHTCSTCGDRFETIDLLHEHQEQGHSDNHTASVSQSERLNHKDQMSPSSASPAPSCHDNTSLHEDKDENGNENMEKRGPGEITSDRSPSELPKERWTPESRVSDSMDRRTPDGRTPDRQTPDGRFTDRQTPDGRTPDRQTPDLRIPDRRTPDGRILEGRALEVRTPDRRTPVSIMPERGTPIPGMMLDRGTPVGILPDRGTPIGITQDRGTPIGIKSERGTPIGIVSERGTPIGVAPERDTPDRGTPSQHSLQGDDDQDGASQNFVITENPTPIIEVSDSSDVSMDQRDAAPAPAEGSTEASSTSSDDNSHWYSIKNHNNSYIIPVPLGGFLCSICGARIQTFKDYEGHCFTSHYRYPCMYCPKTFAQRPNRDRHVCIHTGEKPFSCPECNQKFSRGDKLKLHRMKAHKLEYPGPYVRLKEGSSSSQ